MIHPRYFALREKYEALVSRKNTVDTAPNKFLRFLLKS